LVFKQRATVTPPDRQRLRIVIISEVRIWGEALAKILKPDPLVSAVRLCTDADGAMTEISALPANVVLVDAAITEGAALVAKIRPAIVPGIPLIVFGVLESGGVIVPWAEAGITGYIPDTARLDELVPQMIKIIAGEQPISSKTAAELFRWYARTAFPAGGDAPSGVLALTKRERRVAELIAAGHSNHDIARQLNITLATTKSHVHNLLGKLNLRRRSQVVVALLGRDDFLPQ
jgi:DNA-binding NarL/FixJ family response regulator